MVVPPADLAGELGMVVPPTDLAGELRMVIPPTDLAGELGMVIPPTDLAGELGMVIPPTDLAGELGMVIPPTDLVIHGWRLANRECRSESGKQSAILKNSSPLSQATWKDGKSGFLAGITSSCCAVWGCNRRGRPPEKQKGFTFHRGV